jgi:hypothetical protein
MPAAAPRQQRESAAGRLRSLRGSVLREIVPATRRADANHPGRNATRLFFRGITQKDERVRREPGPTPESSNAAYGGR